MKMVHSSTNSVFLLLIPLWVLVTGTAASRYKGFDGTRFVFTGIGGGHFNIYSDTSHQVNVLFDNFGMEGQTFIKELGLKYGSAATQFAVRSKPFVGQDGKLQANVEVEVGGEIHHMAEKGDSAAATAIGDVQVSMVHATAGSDAVAVTTPILKIQCVKTQLAALHLDVTLEFVEFPSKPEAIHGSIGQTVRWEGQTGDKVLEGGEPDYLVSGLFADDFTFNKFLGRDSSQPSRRKLVALTA